MNSDIASDDGHEPQHRLSMPIDSSQWVHPIYQDAQELQPLQSTRTSQTLDENEEHPRFNERNPDTESKHQSRSDVIDRWWIYEVIALVSSIGCFAALVAVLGVSNGKQQSLWLFGHLTLNGLVALLSTLMRAAMMASVASALAQLKWNLFLSPSIDHPRSRRLEDFSIFDQASRGVWGSIRLMILGASLHIGLIGAVITVLTLAFDTFSQQVVILENREVPNAVGTAIGRLVRSDSYSGPAQIPSMNLWVPDLTTKAAMYAGYFNFASISPPVAQCSTGNCTWPITPSLGVCGSCVDMTDEVSYVCSELVEQNCSYSVPGTKQYGLSQGQPVYNFSVSVHEGSNGDPALMLKPFVTSHYNDSKTIYIEQFIQVEIPNATSPDPTVRACGLWFCIQAYNTTTRNGIQTQEIVGNWSESNIQYPVIDFAESSSFDFTNIPDEYNAPNDTVFSISGDAVLSLTWDSLIDYTVNHGEGDEYAYYSGSDESGSDIAEALFNVTDWDYWIDQFALSMSNNVRQTGNVTSNPEIYDGQVFSSVSFVGVRWAWLAFPIAMLAGSIVFFAVTVWTTHKQHVRPWKSDPIALLLCSVDETIKEKYNMGGNIEKERMLLIYRKQQGIFSKPEKAN